MSTVIDQEALTDISESNPDMAKADEIALQIIESGLFQDVEGKCTIEVTVTDRNDIQLTLSAVEVGDSELCNNKSEVGHIDLWQSKSLCIGHQTHICT